MLLRAIDAESHWETDEQEVQSIVGNRDPRRLHGARIDDMEKGKSDFSMSALLKFVYAAIMLFAVFIVIGGKFPSFGRLFVAEDASGYAVGDQFRMCELDRFREEIPVTKPSATAPLEEAEILTLGDSFFNSSLASDLFANELGKKTGLKIHNLQSQTFFEPQSYPLSFLESIGYQGGRRRILILESVERSVLDRAKTYNAAGASSGNRIDALAFKVLKNSDLEYFFKNNVVVHPLGRWLKNFRFRYFKIVDRSIGSYSEHPDMLFYQRDIEFGAVRKTDAMLDATADSVARLSAALKQRYDIDLIYMVIPNKYSVYHHFVPDGYSYDGFIPRLSRKLSERGVKNMDVYALYSRGNKAGMPLLYFSSDTHYTAYGKSLLVDACAEMIKARDSGNHRP